VKTESCLKKLDITEILEFLEKNLKKNAEDLQARSDEPTESGRYIEQAAYKIYEAKRLWKAALTSLANSE
jgi:hypothetical protein